MAAGVMKTPFSGRNVYLAKHSSTLIFMLKSMTGFGRAEQTVNEKAFLVEIKSLNGKQFEINLKIPPVLKSYEFDVRAMLQERLIRGSIDCLITIKQNGSAKPVVVNTDLIKAYYRQIAI